MNRPFALIFVIGVLAVGISGCSQQETSSQRSELGEIDDSGTQATAVSVEQAEKFASEMESALVSGDASKAAGLVLFDRIVDRIVKGLDLSGKDETSFRRGLTSGNPITAMMASLVQAAKGGGSYSLVRPAVRGGEMHAIFRMVDKSGTLNYHDYRLVLDGGVAKADQIFVAATGESITDTIISTVGPAIQAQQSTMGRMTGDAETKKRGLEQQSLMMQTARSGNATEALKIYESLSDEMKQSKTVQLARVMASQEKPDEEYIKVLSDYTSRFPNDPSVALMSFDRAVMKKDVPGVRKCLSLLEKWTGGDDYLKLLTASVVCDWDQLDYAKELYNAADPAKVGTLDAHNYKVYAALKCKDFAVALKEMRVMRDDFAFEFDIQTNDLFTDFNKSKEFQAWQADGN